MDKEDTWQIVGSISFTSSVDYRKGAELNLFYNQSQKHYWISLQVIEFFINKK